MPRRMSFSKTIEQMRNRTKTVTRRLAWANLEPWTRLTAIEKGMGLKKGERQVVLGDIEVQSVRRERLDAIDADDLACEGFPGMEPAEFFVLLGARPDTIVTRIEFRHIRTCVQCHGTGGPVGTYYGEPPGWYECDLCGGAGFEYMGPDGPEPA